MIGITRSIRPIGRRACHAIALGVAASVVSSLALSSAGCVARRTVGQDPHRELGTGGYSGANSTLVDSLIVRALPRVLANYPRPSELGSGSVRVQFPAGMTPGRRASVEARLAEAGFDVDSAVRGDGPDVYHIGRVWRRGGEAKVDVFRPVHELGMTNGWYPMQVITVEFTGGGLSSWQVTGHRAWAVGAFEPPAWVEPLPADGLGDLSDGARDAGGIGSNGDASESSGDED